MAVGGDGYEMFKGKNLLATHGSLAQIVQDYMTQLTKDGQGTFTYLTDGRVAEAKAAEPTPSDKPSTDKLDKKPMDKPTTKLLRRRQNTKPFRKTGTTSDDARIGTKWRGNAVLRSLSTFCHSWRNSFGAGSEGGKKRVEMCVKWRYATVPFDKKAQRHGRNVREAEVCDRAFCKKRAKARSKCA